jgi:hypothetical protein
MTFIKEFKSQDALDKFQLKNGRKYQMKEVFINNSFGLECKTLLKI